MNRVLTFFVVLAMVAGVAAGWAVHELAIPLAGAAKTTGYGPVVDALVKGAPVAFGIITDLFLRAIKMIIAPLVFTTLVAGIAHMEDAAQIRGVGFKTIAWFILASVVSLTIGLLMVHWLHPGVGLSLPNPDASAKLPDTTTFTLKDFVTHLVPLSIFDAMAKNEILQIVVFSVLVGTAVSSVEQRAPAVMAVVEQGAAIMLKVTGYVMLTAPFAIFAALAASVASHGIEVLWTYAKFVGGFYLSLGVLWTALFLVTLVAVGRRAVTLFGMIRDPALLAFSTASSEAAFPRTLEALVKFGLPRRIVSFVLPLGYSFNLDGSMMYCTFATLFIAQVYNVHLSIQQQITMLLLLMVTSKGMAGVPRASLVVISATLTFFHLPQAGLLLILAVDFFLDMGRSATNVVGNSVAAAVVTRLEGKRATAEPETAPAA